MAVASALVVCVMPGSAVAGFEFRPCPKKPDGPTKVGNAEITTSGSTWRRLGRAGLSLRFVSPAAREGGVPVFPVRAGADSGQVISARLAGGLVVEGGPGRRVRASVTGFIGRNDGTGWIQGKVAARAVRLFRVSGMKIRRKSGSLTGVELSGGRTALSGALARDLRRRTGFRAARVGMEWGGLYLDWSRPIDPDVTPPPPAPPFPRPEGASDVVSGEVTWNVKAGWIQYVASGDPASPIAPGVPGEPVPLPGKPPLVYSFTFPFTAGWAESGPEGITRASIEGEGGVYFRYCWAGKVFKGINFTVSDPEVRLDGASSRLVFTVRGMDGTPFSPGRAVVVDLDAGDVTPASSGGATTWTGIPGTVPADATGVFGGFYGPGTDFGSVDLTIDGTPG